MSLELLRTLFDRIRLYVVTATRPRGQICHGGVCKLFCLGVAGAWPAYAQVPQITAAGVVNAASYAQPISPGSIVSIFGTNLASTTVSARETPLPDKLSGTSVTLNGVTARLFFVSPGQINLGAPWSLQSVQVTVEVSPGLPVSVSAQGITGQVQVFWTYRFVFGGLVLAT